LAEIRKRLLAQFRAHQKGGTAARFEDIDTDLKQRFDILIKELEDKITQAIASDDHQSEMVTVFRSIPVISPVASTMLIAEMPEIATITGKEAAVSTDLSRSRVTAEHFAGNGTSPVVALPFGMRCYKRYWSWHITTQA